MRKPLSFAVLAVSAALAACSNSTSPTVYSTTGTWVSRGFAPATVEMTLGESSRSTTGAGRWSTGSAASAFRVTGARASGGNGLNDTFSLLFDFDGREDVTFEGHFAKDVASAGRQVTGMVGALYGGGYHGEAITFVQAKDTIPS